jgi:uncharacterized protein YdaU (DUF1376 family)
LSKKLSWVKEYPQDQFNEISDLTLMERGAYYSLRLIYLNKKELFFDAKKINAMCFAFTKKEKENVQKMIDRFFRQNNKYPFNYRLDAIEKQAQSALDQRIEAGKKSAEKRKKKATTVATTVDSFVETNVATSVSGTRTRIKKKEKKEKKRFRNMNEKEKFLNDLGVLNFKIKFLKSVYIPKRELELLEAYNKKLKITWFNIHDFKKNYKNKTDQIYKILNQ